MCGCFVLAVALFAAVQVCDATKFNSYSTVWLIKQKTPQMCEVNDDEYF